MIRVTAIETGKARMKTAQRTARQGRGPVGRKIDIFTDRQWVEPLPILCFLVEHPDGRFLIDTGDTWRNSVPGYLPGWNPFYKQVQIRVAPHEEIGPRLTAMGIDPNDIGTVILPDADVKIYVDATPQVRARRRADEFRAKGENVDEALILEDICRRDERDRNRPVAPLVPAKDAHVLDTSDLDVEAAFAAAVAIVEAARG